MYLSDECLAACTAGTRGGQQRVLTTTPWNCSQGGSEEALGAGSQAWVSARAARALSCSTFSPASGFITLIFYMVNNFGACVCVYMSMKVCAQRGHRKTWGLSQLTLRLNSFSCPVSGTVSTPQSLGYRHRQADVPGFLC